MSIKPTNPSFTFAACRDLKRFIGRATATVAANEVALRHTAEYICKQTESDPWSVLAQEFGIRVNGIQTNEVRSVSAKLHIVSIYAGFDRFVKVLHREWFELSGSEWRKNDSDGPFDELIRNAPGGVMSFIREVDESIRIGIDHYRLVRNAVAHPSEDNEQASDAYYDKNVVKLRELGEMYKMTSAPHPRKHIDFHDAKLLAQISIDVTKQISSAFDPGDEALGACVPAKLRSRIDGGSSRRHNRISCFLRTKYGLSLERAEKIASAIEMAH
ncbi:MAG: hypothetical protein HYV06_01715 [Deltaproteobacteria bacterium]|nr:hypothetical protein [Deltaproteobacteria bacterium]